MRHQTQIVVRHLHAAVLSHTQAWTLGESQGRTCQEESLPPGEWDSRYSIQITRYNKLFIIHIRRRLRHLKTDFIYFSLKPLLVPSVCPLLKTAFQYLNSSWPQPHMSAQERTRDTRTTRTIKSEGLWRRRIVKMTNFLDTIYLSSHFNLIMFK
jgi:hypothetical protein